MESAHAILVGLDPSDEISFAMSSGKLMSVHLNDQNGLKYDQDRSFGSVDLRRAFNQVRILDTYQYWKIGMIGLDVKAIRTQPAAIATKHLRNSLHTFLRLVEVARSLDQQAIKRRPSNVILSVERRISVLSLYSTYLNLVRYENNIPIDKCMKRGVCVWSKAAATKSQESCVDTSLYDISILAGTANMVPTPFYCTWHDRSHCHRFRYTSPFQCHVDCRTSQYSQGNAR
jgi:hypothetical protein